jgi:hypothetical protein
MSANLQRALLVVITACIVAIFYLPLGNSDYAGRWGAGTYGAQMPPNIDLRVTSVDGDSPAGRAGVRAGDLLVATPFSADYEHLQFPRAGDRGTFTFERGDGTRYTVMMTAVMPAHFTTWDRVTGFLAIIPATVFLAVAFALVFLRPSVMTWSFFFFGAGFFSTGPSFAYFATLLPQNAYVALSFVLSIVFGDFSVMLLLPFLIRFPDDQLTGVRRLVDRAVNAVIGVAFVAYVYEWYVTWSTGGHSFLFHFLDNYLPLAVFAFATYIMTKKFKYAPAASRQRMGFVVIGVIMSFIGYAVYFVPGVSNAVAQIAGALIVIMPINVAYAVLRHRVLDVNFVLNRALGYSILSIFVIAIVSVLDWAFGHVVGEAHFTVVIELLVTVCVGLLLDRINKGIEAVVEGVFFRHRRLAENYVRRAAAALPFATEENAVSDGLVQIPAEALRLAAAALYRRSADGARFEGVATSDDTTIAPPGFERNHLLVRMLQSSEEKLWLDELRTHLDSENAGIYTLAIPVTVRHELVSFTLYGAHKNGSQIDPEEVALLEELAREAARAYDHIEAVRVRERYARVIATATPETA